MGGHDHLNGASSEAALNFHLGDHLHIRKVEEETEEEIEAEEEEDNGPACSNCSSPFQWSSHNRSEGGASSSSVISKSTTSSSAATAASHPWTEAALHPTPSHFSEGTVMKGRFAKLLLGEDMSGSGNGVCSALALSNAITNLAASVFGELWKLGPLHSKSKVMWRREMEWLLAVSDYIVEFVPCTQTYPDGTSLEVMVSRPRSDLYINLPALKKLDMMLLDILESFREVEFCYVDQDVTASGEEESNGRASHSQRRKDEKWWLPTPKVPPTGLLNAARKHLQQQRECVNQIFKAALSINSQILSEMEIPSIYFESLPKSGRATLGEAIYGFISCECFSPETTLCSLDLITEYDALDVANQIETALYIWHQGKLPCNNRPKDAKTKPSWGIVKDLMGGGGGEHRGKELLAKRAENLLLHLKQKFPGLPQTYLDMTKIQYNKDVGQAILESYSRVIESLAFNIMARIEDILYVDDIALESHPTVVRRCTTLATLKERLGFSLSAKTAYVTPLATPSLSLTPFPSPGRTTPSDYSAYYGVGRPLSCQASMALEDFSKTSEIESHEASEVDE